MSTDREEHPYPLYVPGAFGIGYFGLIVIGAAFAAAVYYGLTLAQNVSPFGGAFDEKIVAARFEAVKVALSVTAGIAAVAGLYVAYRKQRNDEANSLREQDRIFTDRMLASAEMLQSSDPVVRIAAANALARLGDDSARDRPTCASMLATYLRRPVALVDDGESPRSLQERLSDRTQWVDRDEWEVRRNVLALLLRRLRSDRPNVVIEDGVDLRGAVLIDPDLAEIETNGAVNLANSVVVGDVEIGGFFGSGVNIQGVYFSEGMTVGAIEGPEGREQALDGSGILVDGPAVIRWRVGDLVSFKGATFRRGIAFDYVISSIGTVRSTRRLDLGDAVIAGSLDLPACNVLVDGADLSAATLRFDYLDMADIDMSLIADSSTLWPQGLNAALRARIILRE